ncbi:MAG: glycosyltransferase family 2 protein [Candidatus Sulfotelmatobacter sp.]
MSKVKDANVEADEIEVLLATFNGEPYLKEQIDSLLNQDYRNLRVLARDDGSSDGTVGILLDYAERDPDRFRLLPTDVATRHPKWNFLQLLKASTAKYVCLSDQDDVWLPSKVRIEKLAMDDLEAQYGKSTPLLVFTDLRVVDQNLKEIHPSFWRRDRIRPESIHRLQLLLGQSVLTGSTAMLNRKLVELALRMPEEAIMHDRWIALLASAMGKSRALPEPTVLYRQHSQNALGALRDDNSVTGIMKRAQNPEKRLAEWQISQEQAAALLRLYQDKLKPDQQVLLRAYLNCGRNRSRLVRLSTMIRYGFFRSGLLRNLSRMWDLWTLKTIRDT